MAITFVRDGGTDAAKAVSVTTVSVTVPAAGHAAGNTVIVHAGAELTSSSATFAVTDSRGNTYTQIEAGGAGSGRRSSQFGSVLDTALVSGDTITLTITSANATRYEMRATEWSGLSITEDVASQTGEGASGGPSIGPMTPPTAVTLLIAHSIHLGPTGDAFTEDTDTNGGVGWSNRAVIGTVGGTGSSNVTGRMSYKLTTSSAAQTWTPTVTSRAWSASLIALQEAAAATTPQVFPRVPHRGLYMRRKT